MTDKRCEANSMPWQLTQAPPPGCHGDCVCVQFVMETVSVCRLFMEILNSCVDCDEIQFKEDGNWAPMRLKKEVQEVPASYNGVEGARPTGLSESRSSSAHSGSGSGKKVEVIDLTLDSSSEDEEPPTVKRPCPPALSPASSPTQVSPVPRAPSMPPVDTSYIPPPPPLIQDYRHYYHTPSDLSAPLSLEQPTTTGSSTLAPPSAGTGLRDGHTHSTTPRPSTETTPTALYGSIPDVISLD
ncbi:hypothetical protein JZ751_017297 [Albula glossodonta]|uniref:Uncharacterized protein n=1 Tax=Albula glossodonta TaxID=121402 RepID=A0A8T2N216_9TELE|nr:hypothetical protein JZ751_017297 [Albula glossodonta]